MSKKDENEEVPSYDPFETMELEKVVPLAELLDAMASDEARMRCSRYYFAESIFFKSMQMMLNYLPNEGTKECAEGPCANPYGPSHWLSVFQLSCQIAQKENGDLILCALFATMHEIGRDWRNATDPHKLEWMREGMKRIPEFFHSWPELAGVFERHVPAMYIEQFGDMLPKVLYWVTMRWYEDEVSPEELLAWNIESVDGVQFHPCLIAAANACLDADYIWCCQWGDLEPNPKLAHTASGKTILEKMLADRRE
jgi:hypothetical protein